MISNPMALLLPILLLILAQLHQHISDAYIRRLSDIVPSSYNTNRRLAPNNGAEREDRDGIDHSRQLLILVPTEAQILQQQQENEKLKPQQQYINSQQVLPMRRPCYFSPIQCLLRTQGQHEMFVHHPAINEFRADLDLSRSDDQSENSVDRMVISGSTSQEQQDANGLAMDLPISQRNAMKQPLEFSTKQRFFNANPWKKFGF
ncbi:hypothetical protein niasHT_035562 [Heterodera trifolii]|uniref:Uncharacterized protein n=1 Tax=Heterodera trifolii TaxID=157864 RepID=A0ABD2HX13_9BILA